MPKFSRTSFFIKIHFLSLLAFSAACSSRTVSNKPPIASAASPGATEAPVKKSTLVLDQDPPLPGESNQQWEGLDQSQPDQKQEPHHHHMHPPDAASKPVHKDEQEHQHVH